jgi:hypothetical protein
MLPYASLVERESNVVVIKQVPQQPGIPITMGVLLTLCCVSVSLRFWTRIQLQILSWDDYAMAVALVSVCT